MRALLHSMLIAASLVGVLDVIRTREEQNPPLVDLATVDASDFPSPRYVLLQARMLPDASFDHQHPVAQGRRVKMEPRVMVPLVPLNDAADTPTVLLEVDPLTDRDGIQLLPYPATTTELAGWLGPAPGCWDVVVGHPALLFNHRPGPPDMKSAWLLCVLPLLALIIVVLLDRQAQRASTTAVHPPGDFSVLERAPVDVEYSVLAFAAGAAVVALIAATRLMRWADTGVGTFALLVLIPAGTVLMYVGYRAALTEYAVCVDGLKIARSISGTVEWARWSDVIGIDTQWIQNQRATRLTLHLEGNRTLSILLKSVASKRLGKRMEAEVVRRLLPECLRDWERGGCVEFGALAIQQASVLVRRPGGDAERIALTELKSVEAVGNAIVLGCKGEWGSQASVPKASVQDSPLFLALLGETLQRYNPSVSVKDG